MTRWLLTPLGGGVGRAVYLNGKKQPFTPNTWVWLPPWTEHGIDNTGNETMEILVMSGPPNP